MAVARALCDLVRPVKMNYDIHGNTVLHLHLRFLQSQLDDPFRGRQVDLKE
jgi:hypothetical protein